LILIRQIQLRSGESATAPLFLIFCVEFSRRYFAPAASALTPEKPVDSIKAFRRNMSGELKVVRHGGGGEITRFICGYMACHPRLSEVFLAGLPPIFKVNLGKAPSGEWIEKSIRFSVGQAEGPSAARSSVTTRLSEVLFVETLRGYINSLPANQIGWLAAARDTLRKQAGL